MRLNIGLLVSLCLVACAQSPQRLATRSDAALAPLATSLQRYPLSPEQRATTSATIYLTNLDASIEVMQGEAAKSPASLASLASALLLRFRILGRLSDGERALALAEQAAADTHDANAYLVLAAAQSAFHQFDAAAQSATLAERAGADTRSLRRDLWMAQGDYTRLSADFAHSAEPVADFYELAHRADLRLSQGDLDGASRWYRTAQDLYQDVAPLPLAWLYTQQGIALLRYHQYAAAKVFFAAAHARLPQYALAAEHLAECESKLGDYASARTLYRAVIEQTGNPEFMAALADLEQRSGNAAAAEQARAAAEAGYRELLARHRLAYAQHAAQFFLSIGKAAEAYALAQENAALRQDVGSLILLAQTAAAAGAVDNACEAAARSAATGLKPPELAELEALRAQCKAG